MFHGFNNKYPYTDFHELNLDWIIKMIKDIRKEMTEFEILNTITFKGLWSIAEQYPQWSIVSNGYRGYLSLQPVPAGIQLTNTDYWLKVVDYNALFADFESRLTALETRVDGLTNNNIFADKRVVSYGDSTAHNGSYITYIGLLQQYTGCSYHSNRAIAGTRMNSGSNSGTSIINNEVDLGTFDMVTLSYTTNEWQTNRSRLDTADDVKAIINALRSKNSKLEIIFILPFYSFRDFNNGNSVCRNNLGMTLHDYGLIVKDVCAQFAVNVIDLYELSPCNSFNYTNLLRNDSGGPYVHPTDAFAHVLASILPHGCSSKNNPIYLSPMIGTYDWYDAQNNVTALSGSGDELNGLSLYLGAGTTYKSTRKTFSSDFRYRCFGVCDAPFKLTIGTNELDITTGSFNILITVPTQFATINLLASAACHIDGFNFYVESDHPTGVGFDNFGHSIKPSSLNPEVTINSSYPIKAYYTPYGIAVDTFLFTVSATGVAAGGTIATFQSDTKVPGSVGTLVAYRTGGTWEAHPLTFLNNSNTITTFRILGAGSYIVPGAIIPYAPNRNL